MSFKRYLIPSVLIIIVILAIGFIFMMPSSKSVEFDTTFTTGPEFGSFGGIQGAGSYVNLTFSYEGKDYTIEAVHDYVKDTQQDLGISPINSDIKLINNQMKIKGFYNSRKNLLFNYSVVE
jgi:amino acid transporter